MMYQALEQAEMSIRINHHFGQNHLIEGPASKRQITLLEKDLLD